VSVCLSLDRQQQRRLAGLLPSALQAGNIDPQLPALSSKCGQRRADSRRRLNTDLCLQVRVQQQARCSSSCQLESVCLSACGILIPSGWSIRVFAQGPRDATNHDNIRRSMCEKLTHAELLVSLYNNIHKKALTTAKTIHSTTRQNNAH